MMTERSGFLDWASIENAVPILYLTFMVLVMSGLLQKMIDVVTQGKYTSACSKYFTEIFFVHGIFTFIVMYALQPHNLRLIGARIATLIGLGVDAKVVLVLVKYSLQSLLAFLLWDMLSTSAHSLKMHALLNLHHIGLFVSIYMGRGWEIGSASSDLKKQVRLDTCLFGWMWAIHSFGFIVKRIFPRIGINLREGERSKALDFIKHAYSVVTVYWYYQYFNSEGQPGVGSNYQTLSLLTMLCGRFLPNPHVDFLRRVEMPGAFIILVDNAFFKDAYLQRGVSIAVSMLVMWITHQCFVKDHVPKPEIFFGPGENAELRAFLEAETKAVQDGEEDDRAKKGIITWFEGNEIDEKKHKTSNSAICEENKEDSDRCEDAPTSWKMHYPLHYAVVTNDLDLLEQTIKNMKTVNVDVPLLEWHNCTPLHFATYFVSNCGYGAKLMLALLKSGADPYLICDEHGKCAQDDMWGSSLGKSEGFFERYNKICLEKSPPKTAFSKLSLLKRLQITLGKL